LLVTAGGLGLVLSSLRFDVHGSKGYIANATGFVVRAKQGFYAVTYWHTFANRHPDTNEPLNSRGTPSDVGIWFPVNPTLNDWQKAYYPLELNGTQNWTAHPKAPQVDVAVLPIQLPEDSIVQPIPLLAMTNSKPLEVGSPVYIPGFPLGLDSGTRLSGFNGHPICKTCHIATELPYNHNSLPAALVDGTCNQGMSGAPVFVKDEERLVRYGLCTGTINGVGLSVIAKVTTIVETLQTAKKRHIGSLFPRIRSAKRS